jgi:hypothetical protein
MGVVLHVARPTVKEGSGVVTCQCEELSDFLYFLGLAVI